jgi:hypothetical protein
LAPEDGVYRYKPLACPWGPSVNNVSVVGVGMNDRVYVWNPNPHTATLEHRLVSGELGITHHEFSTIL